MPRTNISRTLSFIVIVIYLVLFPLLSPEVKSLDTLVRIAALAASGLAGPAGLINRMGCRAVKA